MARNKSRRERRSAVSAAAAAPPAGSDLATPRRSYRHTVNSAIDATPRSVNNAFATAESGNVRAMMALFKDSRVLDDRLDRVCSDRAEALVGKPLVFKPPPQHAESGRAREIATNVSRLWNATESTGDLIGHLMHAVLEHAAAAEQKWIADGETGWWRAQPLFAEQGFVRSTELAWNKSLQLCLADPSGYALAPLDDYPDRFIRFVPTNGRADYPWRRASRPRSSRASPPRRGWQCSRGGDNPR
jgi:phage gp29-like protein